MTIGINKGEAAIPLICSMTTAESTSITVSIIVTAYNKGPYLRQAVESVLAQTYPYIECLIVDDGSTDHTPAVVKTLQQDYPQIKYFRKDNGGISSARNYGVTKATGDWIQFLDADDWIHPDKTRYQIEHIPDPTHDAVIYSDYERVYVKLRPEQQAADNDGGNSNDVINHKPLIVGALDATALIKRLLICPDFLANSPFPLLQQTMLLKRTLCDRLLFDPRLKACEDRAWVLTLLKQDVPFIYAPMTAAYYRKHQSNLTDNGALMLDSYLTYFELVYEQYPTLKPFLQTSVHYLLEKSIEQKDRQSFSRLLPLVNYPAVVMNQSITALTPWFLQLLFFFRLLLPDFLLYERYRGPRSRKLFALFSLQS
ncbi:MAG: glycosyltransferase family 2 protein [Cyanobacteria bacterium P01_F01_bin.150]